jgi:hypothetical protein
MERYDDSANMCETQPVREVYRVIDDGICVLTTMDSRKALLALMKLMEGHDVTFCWCDKEILQ